MNEYFAQVRRAGFDIGLSAGKLTKAMVEVLLQLPPEASPSKDVIVRHLGLLGQMSKTRDINSAGHRKLAGLAAKEAITPDELLKQLIAAWRSEQRRQPRQTQSRPMAASGDRCRKTAKE